MKRLSLFTLVCGLLLAHGTTKPMHWFLPPKAQHAGELAQRQHIKRIEKETLNDLLNTLEITPTSIRGRLLTGSCYFLSIIARAASVSYVSYGQTVADDAAKKLNKFFELNKGTQRAQYLNSYRETCASEITTVMQRALDDDNLNLFQFCSKFSFIDFEPAFRYKWDSSLLEYARKHNAQQCIPLLTGNAIYQKFLSFENLVQKAQPAPSEQKLYDSTQCLICSNEYNAGLHKKLYLQPCGHSFCAQCIWTSSKPFSPIMAPEKCLLRCKKAITDVWCEKKESSQPDSVTEDRSPSVTEDRSPDPIGHVHG